MLIWNFYFLIHHCHRRMIWKVESAHIVQRKECKRPASFISQSRGRAWHANLRLFSSISFLTKDYISLMLLMVNIGTLALPVFLWKVWVFVNESAIEHLQILFDLLYTSQWWEWNGLCSNIMMYMIVILMTKCDSVLKRVVAAAILVFVILLHHFLAFVTPIGELRNFVRIYVLWSIYIFCLYEFLLLKFLLLKM